MTVLSKALDRIKQVQLHLIPGDDQQTSDNLKQDMFRFITPATRLTALLLIPVGVYYGHCAINGKPPAEILTFSIDTYCQIVGLYALRKMHSQLQENLGVSRTLTRSFLLLSFVGSAIYTTSLLGSVQSAMGKSNLLFNLIYTCAYGYLLYLTIIYNYDIPDPRFARKTRGVVHWNSLFGYLFVMAFTLYIWIKESQASISTGNRYSTLAMMGFILTSFGILRGGFKAAMTSIPVLSPFEAVAPLAGVTMLNTLTKLPHFTSAPLMRTYVAGYFAVSYCLAMIAFLAMKEENRKTNVNSKPVHLFQTSM